MQKEIYSQFPLAGVDFEISYHPLSSTPLYIDGVTCFNSHTIHENIQSFFKPELLSIAPENKQKIHTKGSHQRGSGVGGLKIL